MDDTSLELMLTDDHECIDALWEDYLTARQKNADSAERSFRTYQNALETHMRCEEEIIFPIIDRSPLEKASKEVPTLLDEHESIRRLLAETHALCSTGGLLLLQSERHLFEELHEHNAREEISVYPDLDRLLGPEEVERVRLRLVAKDTPEG